ncbi:FMRFamide receptor-like [Mercenaria mercenaria]|uniref:FMRFamide receptor-like n=1 Tax=Mercenaria mercenaria TaxID=6596 RepID=UPI001E1D4988|nr:FMRFamide receptor-like [Mercenaria mercenaria]XP_045156568.1 FMRFamide receptor-like [Mercenaria mercenaria]
MNISNSTAGGYTVVDLNDVSDTISTISTMTSSNVTNCTSVKSPMFNDIQFIDKTLTPIIYAVGFPGNILSFLIWIRPRMRHSSGVYLAALALVDFIFLVLHLLYELEKIWGVSTINMPVICESFTVIFLTFQYLAPLLVLAFTVERYISICHPFKREQYCTTRRAEMVSLFLAFISLAICAIQGYFWTYKDGECGIRKEALYGDNKSLWNIYSWATELLIFLVVPLSVLTFNMLVIREAKRLSKYEHTILQGRTQKTSATTIMLLAVSFYLIFTTLPVTVVYVSVLNFNEGPICVIEDENSTWRKYYIYHLVRAVIEEIGITHFALNFYIYLITGKMFRKEFKKMFIGLVDKAVPEKIRTEYTTMARTSFRGSLKKNVTVRLTSNGSTGLSTKNQNGSETNL